MFSLCLIFRYSKKKYFTYFTICHFASGWEFRSKVQLDLHTVDYDPMRAARHIPIPKKLADKKFITNMENDDNKCFLWSVLRAINPKKKNRERTDKELKKKEGSVNMEGKDYPVRLKDITKFEKQNPTISVTVLGYIDWGKVYPLRNSEYVFDRKHVVVLILIEEDEVNHYCLVKSLSRLLTSQVSKHKEKKNIFV